MTPAYDSAGSFAKQTLVTQIGLTLVPLTYFKAMLQSFTNKGIDKI